MNDAIVNITGKVTNADVVKKMINRAPEVYRKSILSWMLKERDSFVGSGKKDGVFRKKLLRKKTLAGSYWQLKVVRTFKGWLVDSEKMSMALEMGFPTTKNRKIHAVLESLTKDHTISSSKYMPVPVYKNLKDVKTVSKYFKRKTDLGELNIVRDANTLLYFDKKGSKELLFIGTKSIRVKKQFDFRADFSKRMPNIIKRYGEMIDKATLKAEKI